jgi:hypothetical protein
MADHPRPKASEASPATFRGVHTETGGKTWKSRIRVTGAFPRTIKDQFTHTIDCSTHPTEALAAHARDV